MAFFHLLKCLGTENVALSSIEIGKITSTCSSQKEGKLFQGNLKGYNDRKEEVSLIKKEEYPNGFQMPLHYPRYRKSDYQKMEEWKLDLLLKQYGFSFQGNLYQKRVFAMGAFPWPDQL